MDSGAGSGRQRWAAAGRVVTNPELTSSVRQDVGFPLIFWQQRPGLYGRPFKLYKFRTMRASHDGHRVRIPDDQRSSAVGQALRRARLDELPQLFNVLIGDLSLIGPRPLLPCDQTLEFAARLSVRRGITGWAQVNGGPIISTSDKLVLDVWYVQNASLVLDQQDAPPDAAPERPLCRDTLIGTCKMNSALARPT